MQAQYWWWLIALVMGAAEMFTGSFYLLVLAVGGLAGGLVALASPSIAAQMVTAALVSLIGWWCLRKLVRARRDENVSAQSNRDIVLDIGERVRVERWDEHNRGYAHYRGARWTVELASPHPASTAVPGDYQIVRLAGNTLIVDPLR